MIYVVKIFITLTGSETSRPQPILQKPPGSSSHVVFTDISLDLKRERDGNRPEILFIFLGFEFLRPVNVGIRDFRTVDDHSNAADKIGDERFLVDAVAVPEGVPVKKNIPSYGVPIHGKEKMDAETVEWSEETRVFIVHGSAAVRSRPDEISPEIIREIPAETHLSAQVRSSVNISRGDSHVRNAVESEISCSLSLQQLPLAFEKNIERGLIVELMLPALGIDRTDPIMDYLLAVLGVGMTAYDSDIEFEGVHSTPVFVMEPQSQIRNAGIGSVVPDQVAPLLVLRRVDILSQ